MQESTINENTLTGLGLVSEQAKLEAPIEEATQRLNRAIGLLGENLDRLRAKTQPIRSDYPRTVSSDKEAQPAGSPMYMALMGFANQAERINAELSATINEIEL